MENGASNQKKRQAKSVEQLLKVFAYICKLNTDMAP